MSSNTPNYNFILPAVNDPTDADLWGGYLNSNWSALDTDLKTVSDAGPQPGFLQPYAGASAPSGWLLCYGQSLDTTTYAALFAVIAYAWGGSGSNFNVPDLRGRSLFGKDNMGGSAATRVTTAVSGVDGLTLGAVGGDQHSQLHTHIADVTDAGHTHGVIGYQTLGGGGSPQSSATTTAPQTVQTNSSTTGITVVNEDYGTGTSENMPPAAIVNWIIKT